MYRTKPKIDYYNRFLDSIKSPFTKRVYVNALEHYAKDMGIARDYNKLIEELVNNDPTKIKELEDNLIEYIHIYIRKRNCPILQFIQDWRGYFIFTLLIAST